MKFTTILALLLSAIVVSASAIPQPEELEESSESGCSAAAKCRKNGEMMCATKANGQKVVLVCRRGCWSILYVVVHRVRSMGHADWLLQQKRALQVSVEGGVGDVGWMGGWVEEWMVSIGCMSSMGLGCVHDDHVAV